MSRICRNHFVRVAWLNWFELIWCSNFLPKINRLKLFIGHSESNALNKLALSSYMFIKYSLNILALYTDTFCGCPDDTNFQIFRMYFHLHWNLAFTLLAFRNYTLNVCTLVHMLTGNICSHRDETMLPICTKTNWIRWMSDSIILFSSNKQCIVYTHYD